MQIKDINYDKKRMRKLKSKKSKQIKISIKEHGLFHPIIVSKDGKGQYDLIAGYYRLKAFMELGFTEIEATILEINDEDTKTIISHKENIDRNNLSYFEEALALFEIHEIHEKNGRLHKAGDNQYKIKSGGENDVGPKITIAELAERAGLEKRTYEDRIKIARKINKNLRDKILKSDLKNQLTKLLELARTDADKQEEKLNELLNTSKKEKIKKQNNTTESNPGNFNIKKFSSDDLFEKIDAIQNELNSFKNNFSTLKSINNKKYQEMANGVCLWLVEWLNSLTEFNSQYNINKNNEKGAA